MVIESLHLIALQYNLSFYHSLFLELVCVALCNKREERLAVGVVEAIY